MRADPWSRTAIRGHAGASYQTVHRLRSEMLEATTEGDGRRLGNALTALVEMLNADAAWLATLDPVPRKHLRSERARYLHRYGEQIGVTMRALVAAEPTPEGMEQVGVEVLALMATLQRDV